MAKKSKFKERMAKRKEGAKQFLRGTAGNIAEAGFTASNILAPGFGTEFSNIAKSITEGNKGAMKRDWFGYMKDKIHDVKQNTKDMVQGLKKVLFNHPDWYTNYDVSNMVNLNYGSRKSIDDTITNKLGIELPSIITEPEGSISTACEIRVTSCIPKDSKNSFMQAVSILYAKLRSANSGSVNYSLADLACYILNVRNIRIALCQLRRTLACTNLVSPYDADAPRLLTTLSAGCNYGIPYEGGESQYNGFNFDTVAAHSADISNNLRIWFNSVNALLPLNLPLLDRGDWMSSNIFADSNDVKANYYVFTFGVVQYYTNNNGTISGTNVDLIPSSTTSFEANYQTTISNIDNFISSVTTDTVNSIIAGDILKAFGDSQFYDQHEFPIGSAISPIYDEAALTQIQNMTVLNGTSDALNEIVNFDTNVHTCSYNHIDTNSDFIELNPKNYFINAYKDSVSAGETLSATRLVTVANVTSDGSGSVIESCGSEAVLELRYPVNYTPQYKVYALTTTRQIGNYPGSALGEMLNCWSIMDYSPLFYAPIVISEGGSGTSTCVFLFDFNNYAVASRTDIDNFNQICTLSLLAMPSHIKRQSEFNFIK